MPPKANAVSSASCAGCAEAVRKHLLLCAGLSPWAAAQGYVRCIAHSREIFFMPPLLPFGLFLHMLFQRLQRAMLRCFHFAFRPAERSRRFSNRQRLDESEDEHKLLVDRAARQAAVHELNFLVLNRDFLRHRLVSAELLLAPLRCLHPLASFLLAKKIDRHMARNGQQPRLSLHCPLNRLYERSTFTYTSCTKSSACSRFRTM